MRNAGPTWKLAAETYEHGATLVAPSVPVPQVWNATCVSWHDGDTGTFAIDHSLGWTYTTPVRLLGCNAWELASTAPDGSKPGIAARDAINALIPPGTRVVLQQAAEDKYGGRLDAAVTFLYQGQPTDLVQLLIAEQFVAPWNGAGTKPVPPWPRTVGA